MPPGYTPDLPVFQKLSFEPKKNVSNSDFDFFSEKDNKYLCLKKINHQKKCPLTYVNTQPRYLTDEYEWLEVFINAYYTKKKKL